jgi:uncharacterized protein YjbI with pentapeptide repeats
MGDKVYVKLDGSDLYTPVSTTTHLTDGERVMVTIKNHTAIVTGNISSPAVNLETEVSDGENGSVKIVNLGISMHDGFVKIDNLMAENFEAVNATIENLNTKYATIENLNATNAIIGNLDAKYATIENLNATNATIGKLDAKYATIESLNATNASITNLDAKFATIESLNATNASIGKLDTKYAQIDFANIDEAAIGKIYANIGVIEGITAKDASVTGKLVAVNIHGDVIEGNTIKADKLIVLGDDGLYYKLNVNSLGETTASSDPKYQNGLDGSVIIAESITANKIDVTDLVAFGATIGGFKIEDTAIHSISKTGINTGNGIYMTKDGEMSIGDDNNYLKFYKDTDNSYKFKIGIGGNDIKDTIDDASKTATNYIEGTDKGLIVGNMTSETLGRNVLIDNDSVDIRNGDKVLASYGDTTIYIGKHSENAVIDLCDGSATMRLGVDSFSDQSIYQINSDYGLNFNSTYQIHGSTSYFEDLSWGGSYFQCRSHNPLWLQASREDSSLVPEAIGGVFKAVAYSRINTDASSQYGTWYELKLGEDEAYLGACTDKGPILNSPDEWDTRIRLTGGTMHLTAPFIILNAPDGISIESPITLDNEQIIYGVDASYNVVPVFQPQNEYGNTVVGYGNYTKYSNIINDSNKGNTNIYGQNVQLFSKEDVKLFVNGSDEGFRPYYRKGDSITLLWYGAGYISSNKYAVYVSIPLGKPVIGSPNVSVQDNNGICVRQGGHYCYGSTSEEQYTKTSSYQDVALAAGGTQVRMRINMPNTTNAINNEACGIAASIKITFS